MAALNNIKDPIQSGFVITPDDNEPLPHITRTIYVGTSGDLAVLLVNDNTGSDTEPDGEVLIIPNAPVGYHPLEACMVLATGTTADDLRGGY